MLLEPYTLIWFTEQPDGDPSSPLCKWVSGIIVKDNGDIVVVSKWGRGNKYGKLVYREPERVAVQPEHGIAFCSTGWHQASSWWSFDKKGFS